MSDELTKNQPEKSVESLTGEDHRNQFHKWLPSVLFSGLIAALISSVLSIWSNKNIAEQSAMHNQKIAEQSALHNKNIAENSNYLNVVQTRISSCMALADHYKTLAERDFQADGSEAKQEVDPKNKTVLSSNYTRYVASIYMGRELSVCLANNEDFEPLKTCVKDATHRVYEESFNRVIDDLGKGVFKDHPAC